jgi:hypothetical protein
MPCRESGHTVDAGTADGWDAQIAHVVGGQRHERLELAALGQHDRISIADIVPAEGVDRATLVRRTGQGAGFGTSIELARAQIRDFPSGDGRKEQCIAQVPVRA